jgi:hypothetical protein
MVLVVPNASEVELLKRMLQFSPTLLRLYQNDATPTAGSSLSSFQELTFTGYTEITCNPANWTVTANTSTGAAVATYAAETFTFSAATAGNTVYGYYVVDNNPTPTVMWAERFTPSAPFNIPAAGGNLVINLSISLENLLTS